MASLLEVTVWLNATPEIGPARFQCLENHFGKIEKVFTASIQELQLAEGISKSVAEAIIQSRARFAFAENEMKLARENGIEILTKAHASYPEILRAIGDPPPVLYAKGNLSAFKQIGIAIVGSRRATPYGCKVAESLSQDCARAGVTTVSGLARGIDTAVHAATLEAKGQTIAVLGSGLLDIYPPENKKLADEILANGILLSEFPLKFPPDSAHFPRRNRIISGLSLGTVVVEADVKSGALITAKFALEQGKEVFAVPGPITSRYSAGPNRLIQQGAKLVETFRDITEEIAPLREKFPFEAEKTETHDRFKNLPLADLSPEEKKVLSHLNLEPSHIDFISTQSCVKISDLGKVLLNLELKGVIRALPGQKYVRG